MLQVLSGVLAALFLLQLRSINGQRISAVLTPIIISEGGTFQACFTLSERPFGSDFDLSLTSIEEIEFGPFTDTLTFTDGTTQLEQCIDVTLAAVDNTFRQQNVVNVFMATTTFQGATSMLILGQLFLTDLTVLPIGFNQPTYTFIEGEAAQVCVSVDGFIEGNQVFLRTDLSFTAGTATQFSDYQVESDMVTFDAATTNQMECAILSITLDSIPEPSETLTVRITGEQTPLTINTTRDTATITIIDIPTECEETLTIEDGTLDFSSRSDIGSTATYTCEAGFEQIGGDQVRTCQPNGQWSGVAPACQIVNCGPNFGTLENGEVDPEQGTTFGSQVEFMCGSGFTLLGNQFRECLEDGTWSGTVPTCEVIECPDLTLTLPPFTMITITRISPDADTLLAEYECIPGYETRDGLQRFCDPSNGGMWSGEPPICTIVNCGPPSMVHPGGVRFSTTTFGSITTYQCDDGYVLNPSDETSRMRTCQADGSWFGPDPTCETVECEVLPDPEDGQVVTPNGRTFTNMAQYSCNPGFDIVGSPTRTCEANAQWSGVVPTCTRDRTLSTTLAMTAPTSLQTLSPEGSTSIIGGVIGGVVGGVIVAVVLVIICVVVVMLKRRPSWKPEEPTTDAIGYTNGGIAHGIEHELEQYAEIGPAASHRRENPHTYNELEEAAVAMEYEVPVSSLSGAQPQATTLDCDTAQSSTTNNASLDANTTEEIESLKQSPAPHQGISSQHEEIYMEPAQDERGLYSQLEKIIIDNVTHNTLRLGDQLGSGQFGTVYKGVWQSSSRGEVKVAVKTLKEGSKMKDRIKFLQEATIMGQFKHPNVLQAYGVVTLGEPMLLVLELLTKGNLQNHLLHMRSDEDGVVSVDDHTLLSYCRQVASGMTYLSNKAFVHRDLAARNILVSADETCKIADFGMSRDLADEKYYVSHGVRMIPVKWTAPEALHYRKYSTASDVWSYGVLLYEIWSVGHTPFEGLANIKVLELVNTGYRLPPPPGCPRTLYDIMMSCWHPETSKRPCFAAIKQQLQQPSETKLLKWTGKDKSTHPEVDQLGADLLCAQELYKDLQMMYIEDT